jgi:hypothetical protein
MCLRCAFTVLTDKYSSEAISAFVIIVESVGRSPVGRIPVQVLEKLVDVVRGTGFHLLQPCQESRDTFRVQRHEGSPGLVAQRGAKGVPDRFRRPVVLPE